MENMEALYLLKAFFYAFYQTLFMHYLCAIFLSQASSQIIRNNSPLIFDRILSFKKLFKINKKETP